ncbi:hypothetical protein DFJ74DRAFT_711813 [Hyaloraphidium curvatum]|nr:hypothetical protein DFJ74DRAFT_711813 [Hyaloraphidium curvatum]
MGGEETRRGTGMTSSPDTGPLANQDAVANNQGAGPRLVPRQLKKKTTSKRRTKKRTTTRRKTTTKKVRRTLGKVVPTTTGRRTTVQPDPDKHQNGEDDKPEPHEPDSYFLEPDRRIDKHMDGDVFDSDDEDQDGDDIQPDADELVDKPILFHVTNGHHHNRDGARHAEGLTEHPDGNWYGTTLFGGSGTCNCGTVFRLTPDGQLSTIASFNGTNGASPRAGLIVGGDDHLYGTTFVGGAHDVGTVVRVTTGGEITVLASFTWGMTPGDARRPAFGASSAFPQAPLVFGPDGALYGVTPRTVFRVSMDGNWTVLARYGPWDMLSFVGGFSVGLDGSLIATNGSMTTLAHFDLSVGCIPISRPYPLADGSLVGTASSFLIPWIPQFSTLWGSVWVFNGTAIRRLVTIDEQRGGLPSAGVVPVAGALYGVGAGADGAAGQVFRVRPDGSRFARVVSFTANGEAPGQGGAVLPGGLPGDELVQGADGRLYGFTSSGPQGWGGTVFALDLDLPRPSRSTRTTTSRTATVTSTATRVATATIFARFDRSRGRPQGLVEHPDGNWYGTTRIGGANWNTSGCDCGTVFRLTPDGQFSTIASFEWWNGAYPQAGLIVGADRHLYGTTTRGGGSQDSGTVFRVTTSGEITVLAPFPFDAPRRGQLTLGPDGYLYGGTQMGAFLVQPQQGGFIQLAGFDTVETGYDVYGGVTFGAGKWLYGTTYKGGLADCGVLFRFGPSREREILAHFQGGEDVERIQPFTGCSPNRVLVLPDGSIIGTTLSGGRSSRGTIWRFNGTGLERLHDFAGADGHSPPAGLVFAGGALYGVSFVGSSSDAAQVFRISPDGRGFGPVVGLVPESALPFFAGRTDVLPFGTVEHELVLGGDGRLYGVATTGPAGWEGMALVVDTPIISATIVARFDRSSGAPQGLVEHPDGNWYGTTRMGGANWNTTGCDCGSVFRLTPTGQVTTIASFNWLNGAEPLAAPVVGPDGHLYGATSMGGERAFGAVFRVTVWGTLTLLASLDHPSRSPLVVGPDGAIYGTTERSVFRIAVDGSFSVLANFSSFMTGNGIGSGLALGPDGLLYGTAGAGGFGDCGTLFRIGTDGTVTILDSFFGDESFLPHMNSYTGCGPTRPLPLGDGTVIGTATFGGGANSGTVWRFNGTRLENIYHFLGLDDGRYPRASLLSTDGAIYGIAQTDYFPIRAIIFRIDPAAANPVAVRVARFVRETALQFVSGMDVLPLGTFTIPQKELALGSDGRLYGVLDSGPADWRGMVFAIDLSFSGPLPGVATSSRTATQSSTARTTTQSRTATASSTSGSTTRQPTSTTTPRRPTFGSPIDYPPYVPGGLYTSSFAMGLSFTPPFNMIPGTTPSVLAAAGASAVRVIDIDDPAIINSLTDAGARVVLLINTGAALGHSLPVNRIADHFERYWGPRAAALAASLQTPLFAVQVDHGTGVSLEGLQRYFEDYSAAFHALRIIFKHHFPNVVVLSLGVSNLSGNVAGFYSLLSGLPSDGYALDYAIVLDSYVDDLALVPTDRPLYFTRVMSGGHLYPIDAMARYVAGRNFNARLFLVDEQEAAANAFLAGQMISRHNMGFGGFGGA